MAVDGLGRERRRGQVGYLRGVSFSQQAEGIKWLTDMGSQCLAALLSEERTLFITAEDHDFFWSVKEGRKFLFIYTYSIHA